MDNSKKIFLFILSIFTIFGLISTAIYYFTKKHKVDIQTELKHKVIFEEYKKEYKHEVKHDEVITKPEDNDLKKEKFLFLGWKEKWHHEYYDFSQPVRKDLVLKPKYVSLEVLERAEEKLKEREKYTDESIKN